MKDYRLPDRCYIRRHETEPRSLTPSGIIIHYVSNKWKNPKNPYVLEECINAFAQYNYSYHDIIDRDGNIIDLMPLEHQAIHAGYSLLNGKDNCNSWTFGVALLNNGKDEYTSKQIDAIIAYCAGKCMDYKFDANDIAGHDDVRRAWRLKYPALVARYGKKARKKYDPGRKFPMAEVKAEIMRRIHYAE